MKQKWWFQAVIDGLLNTISYIVLQWFVVSIFFDRVIVDEKLYIFICLLTPIINSLVYYKFLNNKKSIKELFSLTSISALVFVVCMLIRFVCMVTPIFTFKPFQRELSNGDGILILLSASIFLASTIAFRLFILTSEVFRVRRKSKDIS
ncbi:MAG: hypothetical protein IJ275_04460 [Ruminococcus sp.]|nr:hypothetical protein [Ruminococcus sp.]